MTVADDRESRAQAAAAEVRLAYARLFNDNSRPGDGKVVLTDLLRRSGQAEALTYTDWRKLQGKGVAPDAEGYRIYLHELQGRRALFEEITSRAGLPEDVILELTRVARAGRVRD